MALVTLQQLIDRVRQRSDQVGSQFVTDAEITNLINVGKRALDDLLVRTFGDDYYASSGTFVTAVNTENYSLSVLTAGTFYKLLSLSQNGPNGWIDCGQYNRHDRNVLRSNVAQAMPGYGYKYRVVGPNLSILPVPVRASTMEILWIPQTVALASPADSFDDINGWSEIAVLDAAIAVKDKEESDTSILQADRARLEDSIVASAPNRDAGEPMTVADVQGGPGRYGWPYPWKGSP